MRRSERIKKNIVSMTFWIDELAEEAADPVGAGRKMRQCHYTLGKLTYRIGGSILGG